MTERLPPDTVTCWGVAIIRCPWCHQDAEAASVTLADLHDAFREGQLDFARRHDDGTPDEAALQVTCPHCQRPSIVALQVHGRQGAAIRLLAVRTAADVAYRQGATPFSTARRKGDEHESRNQPHPETGPHPDL